MSITVNGAVTNKKESDTVLSIVPEPTEMVREGREGKIFFSSC
jgi:hypothetical protein